MNARLLLFLAVLTAPLSGCCILTYCGPPLTGGPCDAGGGCVGPTNYCDVSRSPAGFCTSACTTYGSYYPCSSSGDTLDGLCALPDGDGGLECTAACWFSGPGARPCPAGFSCVLLDGGAVPTSGSGYCL